VAEPVDLLARLQAHLDTLADVSHRPEFGGEAYYAGGAPFCALTESAALLRLPPREITETLRSGLGRPFVSAAAMGKSGWVEVRLAGAPIDDLMRWLTAAHRAGRQAHRKHRPARPTRARRVRR
jgi:hypothetical protein